jgi:hypothetical protein
MQEPKPKTAEQAAIDRIVGELPKLTAERRDGIVSLLSSVAVRTSGQRAHLKAQRIAEDHRQLARVEAQKAELRALMGLGDPS